MREYIKTSANGCGLAVFYATFSLRSKINEESWKSPRLSNVTGWDVNCKRAQASEAICLKPLRSVEIHGRVTLSVYRCRRARGAPNVQRGRCVTGAITATNAKIEKRFNEETKRSSARVQKVSAIYTYCIRRWREG